MEPFEPDKLTDDELDHLLAQWPAPPAPASMRSSLFGPAKPWYSRLWTASIRVPLPAAVALLLLGLGLFVVKMRRTAPPPPVVIQNAPLGFRELRPVADLNPRIIKGAHAGN
jgi:hypothetical protein